MGKLWKLRTGAAIGLALFSIAASAPACAQDIPLKQKFVIELQDAVRANDKNWLAGHMRYPVRYFGRQTTVVRSKAWFLKNYASVIGPKLRTAVLAQDVNNVFENWQGLMVGEGNFNIWVRYSGDGEDLYFQIITINDVE